MAELHPLLQAYYDEIDPAKRYGHLLAYLDAAPSGGSAVSGAGTSSSGADGTPAGAGTAASGAGRSSAADAYRIALFNARYGAGRETGLAALFCIRTKKSRGTAAPDTGLSLKAPGDADLFLGELLTLLTMRKNSSFSQKRQKKEVLAILRKMQIDDRPLQDPGCSEALYLELRNVVRRYFATCHDSSYGRKLFGLSSSSDREREALRCMDTWNFSYGIADKLDLGREMALLCRAADDEYCASAPGTESLRSARERYV